MPCGFPDQRNMHEESNVVSHPSWSVVTSAAIVARSCHAVYVHEHTSKTLCDAAFVEHRLPKEAAPNRGILSDVLYSVERSCEKMIRHLHMGAHLRTFLPHGDLVR